MRKSVQYFRNEDVRFVMYTSGRVLVIFVVEGEVLRLELCQGLVAVWTCVSRIWIAVILN